MTATSGLYNQQMTAEQMVQAACEDLGYLAAGERASGADLDVGIRQLNYLLKSLTARGANLWREEQIPITFPTGAAAVTLDAGVEDVMAAGVVTGTGFVRELYRYERGEFAMPFNGGQGGVPNGFYIDRQRETATMYVWPTPLIDTVVYADVTMGVQDVSEPDDAVDVPAKWTEAVYSALAARLAGPFGVTRADPATVSRIEQRAAAFEQLLLNEDRPASIYMGASGSYIGSYVPRFVLKTPLVQPSILNTPSGSDLTASTVDSFDEMTGIVAEQMSLLGVTVQPDLTQSVTAVFAMLVAGFDAFPGVTFTVNPGDFCVLTFTRMLEALQVITPLPPPYQMDFRKATNTVYAGAFL